MNHKEFKTAAICVMVGIFLGSIFYHLAFQPGVTWLGVLTRLYWQMMAILTLWAVVYLGYFKNQGK
jgi:hypothetical protein